MKCFFSFLILFCLQGSVRLASKRDETINKLATRVSHSQIKETTQLHFPSSFYKQKGVYPSYIHLAASGSADEQLLRREFKLFDNNAFVTLWISSVLLEVSQFSKGLRPSDEQLLNSIEAIASYHDKNRIGNNSLLVFWTQSYNESTGVWSCGPINLDEIVKFGEKGEVYIKHLLKDLGLEKIWDKIGPVINALLTASSAFIIPADFDDTFLNIGFGALLKKYQSTSTQPYLSWLTNNTNISSAINALKKYSYKPFSTDFNSKSIDPRTYFYIREFVEQSRPLGPLALVSTWVENVNESRLNFYKHYAMPFGVNNVDLTVCTNVLYGLTAAVLSDVDNPKSWFDDQVQMIYVNTTSLLLYEMSNNFSSRPDLSLTYYPSVFNFYWFTARTMNLLNSHDQLPYPVLQDTRERLSATLRGAVTKDLLKRATREGQDVYFDDFLGDNDSTIFGKPVNNGDDRICSTSMAVNTLFYAWNEHNQLVPDLPHSVNDTLIGACNWLTNNAISEHYQHMNAFFSGSIKLISDFPFEYPVTFIERVNGSAVKPDHRFSSSDNDIIGAVSGTIPEDQYMNMLKELHFGFTTPIDFQGYNSDKGPFPFWSSDIFTYVSSLLALTQCSNYNF